MVVFLSSDIFMNVGDGFDICMVVFLSSDIFMNVGDGGGVNLTSIIVGVDNVVDNRGRGISGNVSVSCRGSGISSMVSGESSVGTSISSISSIGRDDGSIGLSIRCGGSDGQESRKNSDK